MKIKKISMLLSVLAFVLLTSVGFAAWVITGDEKADATGNITTEAVYDNRIQMKIELVEATSGAGTDIHYGKPSSTAAKESWLLADSATQVENLSVKVKITITNWEDIKDRINVTGNITVTSVASETGKNYSDAQTYDGVQLLGDLPSEITINNADFASGNGVVEETLTFNWGIAFGSQNPYTYYNAKTNDYADEAIKRLKHLYENLNGVTYKVTVTATASDKSN